MTYCARLLVVNRLTRRKLVLGGVPALTTALHCRAEEGKSLWNGRDLTGWQHAARGLWTVENGDVVGRSNHDLPGPGYLLTEAEYQDFRLRLEFWISKRGNSGIYVREPLRQWGHLGDSRPAHGTLRGYEIQVDYNDKKNLTGAIYGLQRPAKLVGGEQAWHRMEIECRGPLIRISVNGELVNEFSDAKVHRGCIGMQIHGQRPHDHVVKYRNIRLTAF